MVTRDDVLIMFGTFRRTYKYALSPDKCSIISRETKERVCSVDDYVNYLRKKQHCDFVTIYANEASGDNFLECRDCGAIIFSGDDERYDKRLRCPVCGGYHTKCEYWTADEIRNDKEKKNYIKLLKKAYKKQIPVTAQPSSLLETIKNKLERKKT